MPTNENLMPTADQGEFTMSPPNGSSVTSERHDDTRDNVGLGRPNPVPLSSPPAGPDVVDFNVAQTVAEPEGDASDRTAQAGPLGLTAKRKARRDGESAEDYLARMADYRARVADHRARTGMPRQPLGLVVRVDRRFVDRLTSPATYLDGMREFNETWNEIFDDPEGIPSGLRNLRYESAQAYWWSVGDHAPIPLSMDESGYANEYTEQDRALIKAAESMVGRTPYNPYLTYLDIANWLIEIRHVRWWQTLFIHWDLLMTDPDDRSTMADEIRWGLPDYDLLRSLFLKVLPLV